MKAPDAEIRAVPFRIRSYRALNGHRHVGFEGFDYEPLPDGRYVAISAADFRRLLALAKKGGAR